MFYIDVSPSPSINEHTKTYRLVRQYTNRHSQTDGQTRIRLYTKTHRLAIAH